MIYTDTTAIDAVNEGRDTPDAFYHKSTMLGVSKYVRIDGWRGYTEVVPEPGFSKVDDDWTTGDWGDAISDEQGPDATERKLHELEAKYGDIWVIYTPTSNVFSTAYDVLIRDKTVAVDYKTKTIAHKTKRYEYDNGNWSVRYHATHVVSYNAATGRYTLDTGGWNTMTTAKRMTDALPDGWHVYRHNWVMMLHRPGEADIEIQDGMEV